jgi:hypothetical protein
MPWLPTEPYLLVAEDLDRTLAALEEHGFKIVRMQMPDGVDVEVALLTELSKSLSSRQSVWARGQLLRIDFGIC